MIVHPWVNSIDLERETLHNIKKFEEMKFKQKTSWSFAINDLVLKEVSRLGFDADIVKTSLLKNEMNHGTACYFTIEKDFV